MQELKIKFLYGQEFWDELKELILNAQDRIVILSAYQGMKTHEWLKKLVPDDVPFINICRSDNTRFENGKKVSYIPDGAITISDETFHGKMYLIDEKIIVGSQNLYNIAFENKLKEHCKEGEFSVVLEFEKDVSTMVLYQALLSFIKNSDISAEPVDLNLVEFYEDGCPFCGSDSIPDTLSLHTCPGYSMGEYITDEECSSFGDEGSCKYCISENVESIGESYCCSDCGIGINIESGNIIYHAINPLTDNKILNEQAKEFLRIFKFLNKNGRAIEIVKALELSGMVYDLDLDRKESALVNIEYIRNQVQTAQN
ncbi:MAG: hypothetical protein ACOCWM_03530 [Cyclobacteriaceae bacterium]